MNSPTITFHASAGIGVRAIGAALNAAVGFALAFSLGPSDFGIYSIMFTLASVAATGSRLGIPELIVSSVSPMNRSEKSECWHPIEVSLRRKVLPTATILAAICLVISNLIEATEGQPFLLGVIMFGTIPISAFTQIRQASLRAIKSPLLGQLPEATLRPLSLGSILLGHYIILGVPSLLFVAVASMAASSCSALAAIWLSPKPARLARPKVPPTPMHRGTREYALAELSAVFSMQSSMLLVGLFGTAADTGIFALAKRVADILSLVRIASAATFGPRLAVLLNNGDKPGLLAVAKRIAAANSIACGICTASIAALTVLAINRLDTEFAASLPCLAILLAALNLLAWMGPTGTLLTMAKRPNRVTRANLLGLICTLTLGYPLLASFGPFGAATASAAGLLITGALMLIWSITDLNVNPSVVPTRSLSQAIES